VRQFNVGNFVYLQRQPNDTLDISSGRIILKIKAIKPSGVLELQGGNERTIQDHSKNYARRIWILPSSCRFGFLHLTIHVKYVKGHMMLIKCCFAIIVMVDTIYFASNRNSLKFLPALGIVYHVLM
jgi:hypothetical protein